MPVIRGQAKVSMVTAELRQQVAEQLAQELAGSQTEGGPIIYEIPLDRQNRTDILVIWDAWEPFNSTDRSDIITDIYHKTSVNLALALGLTYPEAIEQRALPYRVAPMVRRGELSDAELEEVKSAMLSQGGFALEGGNVELRLPTLQLAEEAHRQLTSTLPKGYWSIAQTD